MAVSNEYLEYLRERLGLVGTVTFKKMFGGAGVYINGRIMGLVSSGDMLFFKVDEKTRPDYEKLDLEPFKPFEDKPPMMYYEIPGDILEDDDLLREWGQKAVAVSERAPQKPKRKK